MELSHSFGRHFGPLLKQSQPPPTMSLPFLKLPFFLPVWQPICGINAHSLMLWKLFQPALWCSWSSCQEVKRLKWGWQKLMSFLQNYLSSQKGCVITISGGWGALRSSQTSLPPTLDQLHSRHQQTAAKQGLWARTLASFTGVPCCSCPLPLCKGHACMADLTGFILCFVGFIDDFISCFSLLLFLLFSF